MSREQRRSSCSPGHDDPRGGRCEPRGGSARSALPLLVVGRKNRVGYEPEGALEPGGEDGCVPEPAGGVPVWLPEAPPMSGQLWAEPDPDPELELEPDDVLEEPELVLLEPVFPVPELDDGVEVDELVVEPEPVLPVVVDVVAAFATNAPPATRPEVSAPMANTFRRRIFIGIVALSLGWSASPSGPVTHTVHLGSGRNRTMR